MFERLCVNQTPYNLCILRLRRPECLHRTGHIIPLHRVANFDQGQVGVVVTERVGKCPRGDSLRRITDDHQHSVREAHTLLP